VKESQKPPPLLITYPYKTKDERTAALEQAAYLKRAKENTERHLAKQERKRLEAAKRAALTALTIIPNNDRVYTALKNRWKHEKAAKAKVALSKASSDTKKCSPPPASSRRSSRKSVSTVETKRGSPISVSSGFPQRILHDASEKSGFPATVSPTQQPTGSPTPSPSLPPSNCKVGIGESVVTSFAMSPGHPTETPTELPTKKPLVGSQINLEGKAETLTRGSSWIRKNTGTHSSAIEQSEKVLEKHRHHKSFGTGSVTLMNQPTLINVDHEDMTKTPKPKAKNPVLVGNTVLVKGNTVLVKAAGIEFTGKITRIRKTGDITLVTVDVLRGKRSKRKILKRVDDAQKVAAAVNDAVAKAKANIPRPYKKRPWGLDVDRYLMTVTSDMIKPLQRRRRLGWKPSHDIPRRHPFLHPRINRIFREGESQQS